MFPLRGKLVYMVDMDGAIQTAFTEGLSDSCGVCDEQPPGTSNLRVYISWKKLFCP